MTLPGATTHFEPAANPLTESGDVSVGYGDNHHIDAFGRLRVSNPTTIWDSQFQYDLQSNYYDTTTETNGTVTHNTNHASVDLTVTTDDGSKAIIQSFEYFRYQPGKSQTVTMTFLCAAAISGLDQRVGQFDDDNGFFLELTGTTVNMVRRTKTSGTVANNATAQASWNIDVMDGTGRSGVTLDLTKVQILHIDYQWLSTGRIRFGFDVGGVLHYAHEELIANTITTPSTTTANLPVRWEADTTAAIASQSVLEAICVSVTSEGGQEFQSGLPFSFGRESATAADNTEEALIGIRAAATLNSIAFRGKIAPESVGLLAAGAVCRWRLRYNPTTLTNVSWQAPVTGSGVQTDIATTVISGGTVIAQGFVAVSAGNRFLPASGTNFLDRLPLTLDADGTQTISLFLTIEGVGGTTTVHGDIEWEEIR